MDENASVLEVNVDADVGVSSHDSGPASVAGGDADDSMPSAASLGRQKRSLVKDMERKVLNAYRGQQVDISILEVSQIAEAMVGLSSVHVSEIYCPSRFSKKASRFGLVPGICADLQETKAEGTPWDLEQPADVEAFMGVLDREEPKLLIGCPPLRTVRCDQAPCSSPHLS